MQIPISSVADLGLVVRAVRRSTGVRMDDLAATTGVGKQFASDVEHGKPTVQLGLVLKLLLELGVPLKLDISAAAERELAELRRKGGLSPPRKRLPKATSRTSDRQPSGSKHGGE
jgi:transcriptional regulator with XRE-family HTH domain